MLKRVLCTVALLTIAATGPASAQALKVDKKLKNYQTVGGVSGNLNSIGSDTLNNLLTMWAEGFRKKYPNVNVQIEGKGSSTAPGPGRRNRTAGPHVPRDEKRRD